MKEHSRQYSDNKTSPDTPTPGDNHEDEADEISQSQTDDSNDARAPSVTENNEDFHAVTTTLPPLPHIINHGGTVNIHYHVFQSPATTQVEVAVPSDIGGRVKDSPTDLVPDRVISGPEKELLKNSVMVLFNSENDRASICKKLEVMAHSIAVSRWDQTRQDYVPIAPSGSPLLTSIDTFFSNPLISPGQPFPPRRRSECPEPNSGTFNQSMVAAVGNDHATYNPYSPPSSLIRNPSFLRPLSSSAATGFPSPPAQNENQEQAGGNETVEDPIGSKSHSQTDSAKEGDLVNSHDAGWKDKTVEAGKSITGSDLANSIDSNDISGNDQRTHTQSDTSATPPGADDKQIAANGKAWSHRKALTYVKDPKMLTSNTTPGEEAKANEPQQRQNDTGQAAQSQSSSKPLMSGASEKVGRKQFVGGSWNLEPVSLVSLSARASKSQVARPALSLPPPPSLLDRAYKPVGSSHGAAHIGGKMTRPQTRKAAGIIQEQGGSAAAMPKVVDQPHQDLPVAGHHKKSSSDTNCEMNSRATVGKVKPRRDNNLAVINQAMAQMQNAQTGASGSHQSRGPSHLSFLLGGTPEIRTCRFCKRKFTDANNVRQPDGSSPCSYHPGAYYPFFLSQYIFPLFSNYFS